jgi:hypothetical protein
MVWSKGCQMQVEDIKQELKSNNIMIYPNWNEKFIFATDASKQSLEAVPQIKDGKERPIAYVSRGYYIRAKLRNLTARKIRGNLGLDKFRPYLSHQKFSLVTYHRALIKLKEVKDNNLLLYQ